MLKEYIANIRAAYTRDFTSEDEVKQQRAVATYLIDKLGLRSGTDKLRTGKYEDDYLFDKLDTTKLNTHLNELMPGLTFEVFRIYNTSVTLENMVTLEELKKDLANAEEGKLLKDVEEIGVEDSSHSSANQKSEMENGGGTKIIPVEVHEWKTWSTF